MKTTTLFQLTNGFQNRRISPMNGHLPLAQSAFMNYICYKCYYHESHLQGFIRSNWDSTDQTPENSKGIKMVAS
jgi:hypothetical protein